MLPPAITRKLPLLLGFLIAVGPLSTDMYLPAFPQIGRDFQNAAAPQISLAAYFIGLACGQLTQGALSDRLGRRAPLLGGLIIYTLASIGCALCWNVASFALFRFLAAAGCSAGIVIPRAMVRDLADGPAAARLFSKLILVMGVAPIIAPALGSFIMQVSSWRMIFGVAAAYGVLACWLTFKLLPDTLSPERRSRIGVGPVLVRYFHIFNERAFIANATTGAFASAALFAYLAGTPQIFIGGFGFTTLQYAALFGFNGIAYIGYNQLNPVLVNRFGLGPVLLGACFILLVACLGLAALALYPQGPLPVMAGLLVAEMGFGLILPTAMVGALSRHQAHAGSASALMGTMQYGGGAIASFILGALGSNLVGPMAVVMLICALASLAAALARPPLVFSTMET